ncbi:MAG: NAD(P)H-binding protein [Cytophagaceae bacterium]|jgi:uncharacterized protein YbjT (DUF2867 family)|nr:NAD(P)H-binding protein [Cytophagaceae bacterium]
MKIVLTGSIGHVTKPLASKLIAAGHQVSIISSDASKVAQIQSLGAQAHIGSIEDGAFLREAFAGANAVYLMIPPKWTVTNWLDYQRSVGQQYVQALEGSSVTHVVILSSVGAHMKKGAGPIDGVALLEDTIAALPGVHVKSLRPSYFYYNLFSMIPLIKNAGIMGATQSPDHTLVLTHTEDIAQAAFEELNTSSFQGFSVRYIASDERAWSDIASVLGKAIGKDNLPFVEFTDEQSLQGMLQAGLSPTIAEGYTAMGKALRSGEMQADYFKNKPSLGSIKLEDFAKEFAGAYNAS